MLRHLRQGVDGVEEHLAPAPEVVGDVGGRGPGEGRPAAAARDPVHPVAELVARQPRPVAQVGAGEPAQGVGGEQAAVGGVLDPVLHQGDPLDVLLDRRRRAGPAAPAS